MNEKQERMLYAEFHNLIVRLKQESNIIDCPPEEEELEDWSGSMDGIANDIRALKEKVIKLYSDHN